MYYKDVPEWVFYQIDNSYEPPHQVLRLNGRPEVVVISPEGIRVFTSVEAFNDGLPPLSDHKFYYQVAEA